MSETTVQGNIVMNEQLNIAIDRVEKLDDPLLVIGLGGTGADILLTIKRMFAERFTLPRDENGNPIPIPRRTDYLAIDSSKATFMSFEQSESLDISVNGLDNILAPDKRDVLLNPCERAWLDPKLNAASNGIGAGTYRQAARLMLSRNYSRVYNTLKTKLTRLASVEVGHARSTTMRMNVVIVAGICGGTGSGTFLDVAQIVRKVLADDAALANMNKRITGYIVMPDISCAHVTSGGEPMQASLKANGYAALKELDFWMNVGTHKTPYTIRYSDAPGDACTWNMPPFDACILMSGTTVKGDLYQNSYDVMRTTIAENLLHYLAYEQKKTEGDKDVEYSYISYEDNLARMVIMTPKKMPLYYGYRAVGAYTKRIPKTEIMYYEGEKLLRSFVPPRDPNGNLVPNRQLLADGQNVIRAQKIAGNLVDLERNAATHVALPAFLSAEPEQLRNLNPAPHDRADFACPTRWESDVLPPAMARQAEAYLKNAWETFQSFATAVITDPAQGPFSLKAYLEDPGENGLLSALRMLLNDWKTKRGNLESKRTARLQNCKDAYSAFLKPPLLGKQKAENAYMDALKGFYGQVRAQAFLNAFIPALEKLNLRIQEYLSYSLNNMCEDLLGYYDMFGGGVSEGDQRLVSNIYDLRQISESIDNDFAINNVNFKFERMLLGALCTASLKTEGNVDPHSSGASFPYQREHLRVLYRELRSVLDQCFGTANGQSLDAIMQSQAGADVNAQNRYMDELAESLLNSSVPMFSQNPSFAAEDKAAYSYLSVPDDAPKFIQRYQNTLSQQLSPKASSIHDHMYCVTAWDGLPLYRYSMMEKLSEAYESSLNDRKQAMGIHLVFDPDKKYANNWVQLPDPCPYYLFAMRSASRTQKRYEEIRAVIMRAIACGIITVNDDTEYPTYSIGLHYTDALKNSYKSSATIQNEANALMAELDPVTKTQLAPDQVRERLEGLLAQAVKINIAPACSPTILASSLGLTDSDTNPWNTDVISDPARIAQAKKNFHKLSQELAAVVLDRYPLLFSGIEVQIEGVEYVRAKIAEINQKKQIWEPRIAFAPTFAKMYIHGVVLPGLKGYQYVDLAGQKVTIIEDQLLADDLKAAKNLLKNVAYLADLDQTHTVRQDLLLLLEQKERELEESAESERLTADDLTALIAKISKLVSLCDKEKLENMADRHKSGVDKERLDKINQLYQAMLDMAHSLESTYQDVLDNMA